MLIDQDSGGTVTQMEEVMRKSIDEKLVNLATKDGIADVKSGIRARIEENVFLKM